MSDASPTTGRLKVAKFIMLWAIILSGWSVVIWKAIFVDISRLDLSIANLTSLAIALFSIGLSVALYIRSERVSSSFFTRSAEFTERVAELISRVELSSLDRSGQLEDSQRILRQIIRELRTEIGQRQLYKGEGSRALGDQDEHAEARAIVDQCDQSASQNGRTADRWRFGDLDALVAEVGALEAEYRLRMRSVSKPSIDKAWSNPGQSLDLPSDLVDIFRSCVRGALGGPSEVVVAAPAVLESRFAKASRELPTNRLVLARQHALVDDENHLTAWGILLVRRLAESEMGFDDP